MPAEPPVWIPDQARCDDAQLRRFWTLVEERTDRRFADYAALHRWSIEHPAEFWADVADFCDLKLDQPCNQVLIDGDRMPGARWFDGARLNFAANLLRFRDERMALVFHDEAGRRQTLSYSELYCQVAGLATGLRQAGVIAGDRVAGIVPNCPEAVIAMLATTSIGAIWSSCSPDFGITGVLDRFSQIGAKVLIAADGYHYGGKRIDCLPLLGELSRRLDGLERTIVLPFLEPAPSLAGIEHAQHWADFAGEAEELEFVSLPFDHPVYILYSSGTTGKPKCIVHGAGGTLLQHLKEHRLHTDLGRDDTLFFFTTCGWMMWNWLVSGLASGATLVLYDGSPFKPDAGALWRIATAEGVTIFGAGARYFAAIEKSSFTPRAECDLAALRTVQSTGSPLTPASFDFIYAAIKPDVALQSISGGTDLLGCFALGNPLAPVYRGELQCLGLGMAVEIFADDGTALPAGQKGELVCTQPFPSMPVGFWNDPDDSRYHAAYFERFAQVWAHGDYAELTGHGGMIIYGRSDATLNPGGVRIGTAEIYRQVETINAVLDSLAIDQAWQNDTRIILFVVLRDDAKLDTRLRAKIRDTIRVNTSPRHVPAKIIAVPELPRTRSGKLVELAVRAVVNGDPVPNIESLDNPEALEYFRSLAELS